MPEKIVEYDVETTGLQPYSGKHYAFLFQFYDGENAVAYTWAPDHQENREAIQAWFDKATEWGAIRAYNSKFDRHFGEQAGFKLPPDGMWYDGMIDAHTIDERRSVALKRVATDLFGEGTDDLQKAVKGWLNKENARRRKEVKEREEEYEPANYSDVPMDIMEPYGLEDVLLTRRVADNYEPILEQNEDLFRTVEFEREVLDALYAVERRGLPARQAEYRKLLQEVSDNLEVLEDKVIELAKQGDPVVYAKELAGKENWGPEKKWIEVSEDGVITSYKGGAANLEDFNPNSSAQVLAALKARGADMRFMSEKDGSISADADNLRAVDDELAAAILEFRAEKKVHSTYVLPMVERHYVPALNSWKEPFIGPDERIHATYRQVGARTGRMSCADPNMQNQPRDDLRLRYNIVADPGYKIVTCDLSNIEMVLFAAFCGPGRLLKTIQEGGDLHELTAAMLGFRDRARPGGGYESARQQGKVYNFTIIYGGGLRSIRRYFRVDINTAKLYKRRYNDAYPEVGKLQTRIDHALHDRGYVQDNLISGRRFRVDPKESYKATNYLVQGTAAALLKWALVQLHKDGVPVVALVHDEIVAHVPEDEAEQVRDLIVQRMTEHPALQDYVTLRADGDIVDRWSDAKPLKDQETGCKYLFTPQWAGGERRWIEEAVA